MKKLKIYRKRSNLYSSIGLIMTLFLYTLNPIHAFWALFILTVMSLFFLDDTNKHNDILLTDALKTIDCYKKLADILESRLLEACQILKLSDNKKAADTILVMVKDDIEELETELDSKN
jgi:hypothetical protein